MDIVQAFLLLTLEIYFLIGNVWNTLTVNKKEAVAVILVNFEQIQFVDFTALNVNFEHALTSCRGAFKSQSNICDGVFL